MPTKAIEITHNDIPITYDEHQDKWMFTLRGRERKVDSLKAAKDAIDKPAPKPKGKPFERFKAWYMEYNSEAPETVEVLSIVDAARWRGNMVRVRRETKKDRTEEVDIRQIFPRSSHNDEKIQEIIKLQDEIKATEKAVSAAKAKLKPYQMPPPEEE